MNIGRPAPSAPGLGSYVAFDLETTGLDPSTDRIIEIGAVRFEARGRELGRFESLVRPDRPLGGSSKIHGLSDVDLAGAQPIESALARFLHWLGPAAETRLIAHHARIDAAFLGAEFSRLGHDLPEHRIADTLSLARQRRPESTDHKLMTLETALGLDSPGPGHRALADSLRVMRVWQALEGPSGGHLTYRIFDPRVGDIFPEGWEPMSRALAESTRVRIVYDGGSHGTRPREITPLAILHLGGVPYLQAHCHLAARKKRFRLDRISAQESVESTADPVAPARRGRRRGRRP